MIKREGWPHPLVELCIRYPPEKYRCAACKAEVELLDARWRIGFNGWEHACPDHHPQAGHCPSELSWNQSTRSTHMRAD